MNLVGGFQVDGREVDNYLVSRAQIVVDTFEGALAEAGDLLIPLHDNIITKEQIIADLHQIVSGKLVGPKAPDNITVFKSVGFALEDLVIAALVYERALLTQENEVESL